MNYVDLYKENRSSSYKKSIEAARKALSSLSFNRLPVRQSPQPIDKHPKHVFEYSKEIMQNLKQEESQFDLSKDFLKHQAETTHHGRAILINWLVSIHRYLKLVPETLHLAVSLIDRFLHKKSVSKYQLQLLGLTSLFLAAKYEEIYPPEFSKFLKICENAYSKSQVVLMEKEILKVVDFKVNVPTVWIFFNKYAECAGLQKVEACLAQYLTELCLLEHGMTRFRNSMKAASVVFLAQKQIRKENVWRFQGVTGYQESDLKECVVEMTQVMNLARFNPLKAVREKFSTHEFENVSGIN
jgi:cyclin B